MGLGVRVGLKNKVKVGFREYGLWLGMGVRDWGWVWRLGIRVGLVLRLGFGG